MKKVLLLITLVFSLHTAMSQNYPANSDVLWVTTPNNANWIYKVNEQAKITIQFYLFGVPQNNISVNYSIGPELMKAEIEGSIALANGTAELSLGTLKKPGFLDCKLNAKVNGITYSHHIKLGFDPNKLQPYTQLPSDFKAFWGKAKAKAETSPVAVEKTFAPQYSSDKVDCYLIRLQTSKEGYGVYGYLSIPKRDGKFPVVFSPPGAGIKPMDPLKHMFYAEEGIIRFDIEIHGIRPDLDAKTYKEISCSFGEGDNAYLLNGIEDRDRYYLKKVYLACVRSLDYLTSLPQWDGRNLISQGGSQGGALALVTAGLDSRVTACAASHPALSDMAGYLDNRAGGYPHMLRKDKKLNKPEVIKTLQYYDVVNFAKNIDVPVFMTWGFNDDVCPPTTSYIVYNEIKSKKDALITPINEHWVSDNTRHVILDWIKSQLK